MNATGAETWGMAMDGAWEVRAHATRAEMQGMATDGARDGAETQGAQRGGVWACVRGVDMGEMRATAMCIPRGLGCTWHVHEGCRQGQWLPMVHGLGAEAAVLQVDRLREAQQIIQVMWPAALRQTEAVQGPVVLHWP